MNHYNSKIIQKRDFRTYRWTETKKLNQPKIHFYKKPNWTTFVKSTAQLCLVKACHLLY